MNNIEWPWKKDRKEWNKFLKKSIALVGFNAFIVAPALTLIFVNLKDWKSPYKLSYDELPTASEMALQYLLNILLDDMGFYFTHRMLHSKYLYSYIHKVHHEFNVTLTLAVEYAHPIEYFIGNIIPSQLGPMILGKNMHLFTYLSWIGYKIMRSSEGHSGYSFNLNPLSALPFATRNGFHDYHHSHNIGNYGGAFYIWDWVFGSLGESEKYEEQVKKERTKLKYY